RRRPRSAGGAVAWARERLRGFGERPSCHRLWFEDCCSRPRGPPDEDPATASQRLTAPRDPSNNSRSTRKGMRSCRCHGIAMILVWLLGPPPDTLLGPLPYVHENQ